MVERDGPGPRHSSTLWMVLTLVLDVLVVGFVGATFLTATDAEPPPETLYEPTDETKGDPWIVAMNWVLPVSCAAAVTSVLATRSTRDRRREVGGVRAVRKAGLATTLAVVTLVVALPLGLVSAYYLYVLY